MYNASAAFHQAVKDNKPQIALLIFDDSNTVLTNEDIELSKGIDFHDYFCTEDDLTIGQTISNEIEFTVLNDKNYLDSFAFGKFKATLGVQIADETYKQTNNCRIVVGSNTYYGSTTVPYLKKNSTTMTNQPWFGVRSMLCYNGLVYCFGGFGDVFCFNESTGNPVTVSLNQFMLSKVAKWDGNGYFLNGNYLYDWVAGHKYTYEFVPLGIFTADKPNVSFDAEIDLDCYDQMELFDDDFPSASEMSISYPITFKNLLTKLCEHVGVTNGAGNFINYNATVDSRPKEFDECTMRDFVGWLAEAACANARFDRDGVLKFEWLQSNVSMTFDEGSYQNFRPYWYQTKQIQKVISRQTFKGTDKSRGSGKNAYLIQDNPLLKEVE